MKKINKFLLTTFASASITMPIFAVIACGPKNDNFKPVRFNNKTFTSKSELLSYISQNIDKLSDTNGDNKVFSINEGKDQKTFGTYQDALDYIGGKIETKTVYLNKDALKSGAKIAPSDFVEKSQTEKYYVFEKWTQMTKSNGQGVNVKQHEYTYVSTNATPEEINKARLEAAATYIQIHNGYFFNGIYFANSSELTQYLQLQLEKIHDSSISLSAIQQDLINRGSFKRIFLDNGTSHNFKANTDLAKDQSFRTWVNQNARPYFVTQNPDNSRAEFLLNNSNQSNIAMNIDESKLAGIRIESNGGRVTQVVDMDRSTPNGQIYGGYFVQSAESVDGIKNVHNWNRASQLDQEAISDSNNIQIVKSFIDYILVAQGISSPIELMDKVIIENDETKQTFFKYLGSMNSATGNGSYLQKASEMFSNLAKGSRYSTLDTMIVLHSYLINLMIQDKQSAQEIIKLSKYFSSMTKLLDTYTTLFLQPFFSSTKDSIDDVKNFKVNYFENAFHFYDETKSHGISFQDSPYSYYRTLVGHIGDATGQDQITYFNLIKAMMGMQAISMKALRINQINLVNFIAGGNDLTFTKDAKHAKNDGQIWDFKFQGFTAGHDSEEYKSIWTNLDSQMSIKVGDKTYTTQDLQNNFNNYLTKYQNVKIDKYLKNISDFSKQIYTLVTAKNYQTQGLDVSVPMYETSWILAKDLRRELSQSVDTFSMIDIDTSNKDSNIVSSQDEFDKFDKMQNSLVDSIDDRIASFVSQVGKTAGEVGGAIVAIKSASKAAAEAARSKANEEAISKEETIEEISTTITHDASMKAQVHLSSLQGNHSISAEFDYKHQVEIYQRRKVTRIQTKLSSHQESTKERLSKEQLETMDKVFSALAPEINLSLHRSDNEQFNQIQLDESLQTSYQDYLKSNPAQVMSFEDFKANMDKNEAQPTIVATADELGEAVHSLLSAHTSNGIASILGMVTGSSTVEAVSALAINIASTIVPGFAIANSLINFISSFEGSEQQIYTYGQHEQETRFYWDGGEKDYSWWGLSQTVKYDLNDLKMIVTPDVISAYSNSGYYFDGSIYTDTVQLRAQTANELIENYKRMTISSPNALANSNIEWKINIKNTTGITYSSQANKSLEDFYSEVAKLATDLSETVYVLNDGTVTANNDQAKKEFIQKIVQSLSECTIITLPTKRDDGTIIREDNFTLPRPYWSPKDGLTDIKDGDTTQANYIIKNPNVNPAAVTSSANLKGNEVDRIKDLIKDEAKDVNPSADAIEKIVEGYAANIAIPTRENIFEDLRDPQNSSYEDLENSQWSTEPTNIYSFTKIDSMFQNQVDLDAYYLQRSSAMNDALKIRYRINAITKTNFGVAYRFRPNNQIYHSVDQIYESIVNAQNKGENHE